MCTLTYFEHKICKHTWVVVTIPCRPYTGFNNCPTFCNGVAKEPPRYIKTNIHPCPKCHLCGMYDRNMVRMVEGMGWGIKFGVGPGRDDWGFEMKMPGKGCVIL